MDREKTLTSHISLLTSNIQFRVLQLSSMEPERKDQQAQTQVQEGVVKEIPDVPEIPKHLEKVAQPAQYQVTAKVTDDSGKPMMTSPATQKVTITIPAAPTKLADWSKGSATNSLTWFAAFWLRLMKKALHFGWKIVMKAPMR